MPIANCKRCGRMYNRVGREICPECIREEDRILNDIRNFLRKNKLANISELSDGTGVEYGIIVDMIRDGRLMLRDNPNLTYPCERCGEQTQSGRLCARCTQELARNLSAASAELRDKQKQGNRGKGFYSRNK
ncbi:hypothetical protein NZD89_04125 [Alicyclobacillus fastidiosus]|uniref:Flagellar protein n=1 Tax=Alicyclobacillus fastidiosus TaxID=392011 RepID=A0ABY6ZID5_9BACL|nr:TIGR03826 family flagellar region protein [Alicyclobacillus fastidiosus]WAH42639.1 hypothetical protein NZD89_04125 [Alicyclobacillus fastidiosus]GMA64512.1 hypothetical protein GCM10025859_49520 [Alicyclobacillus fastidiosus]